MQNGGTYVAPGYNTDNHVPQAGASPVDAARDTCQRPWLRQARFCKVLEDPHKNKEHEMYVCLCMPAHVTHHKATVCVYMDH